MNLRALLELMRVSNLPTVWSNVVLGVFAGGLAYELRVQDTSQPDQMVLWLAVFAASVGMSMMYAGGMMVNDVLDIEVDRLERPDRPLPSGRVGIKTAIRLVMACFSAGLLIMTFTERFRPDELVLGASTFYTALLLGLILAYNRWHQNSLFAVLLMGMCRAMVVLSTAAIFGPSWLDVGSGWLPFIYLPAVTLVAYTILISLVARREVDPERGGFGGPKTVMNMIAAMPLLDAVWLVAMGLWPASLVCVACAGLTKLGHRRIAGS